jgi:5'/3'-nucleotidase SurE
VVNDDGPPSLVSPYLQPFIDSLHAAGHSTYVVIPDTPLSWIGKAHAVGKTLTGQWKCPDTYRESGQCTFHGGKECQKHQWLLLNGAPASCTQIGLFHIDIPYDEIDLVVSGPNHGRNASNIYTLSSGTVGGALEAALCGKRSIAVSFGSKEPQPLPLIKEACTRTISIIEHICRCWEPEVDLYNLNIPMVNNVKDCAVKITSPTKSHWTKRSLFQNISSTNGDKTERGRHCEFRWMPELSDIKKSADISIAGEDLWASKNGFIRSVLK